MLKAPIIVIAVSETWLTESLNDVYSIPGYNFFAKSCTGKTGGGVGLYVNNSFDCVAGLRLDSRIVLCADLGVDLKFLFISERPLDRVGGLIVALMVAAYV